MAGVRVGGAAPCLGMGLSPEEGVEGGGLRGDLDRLGAGRRQHLRSGSLLRDMGEGGWHCDSAGGGGLARFVGICNMGGGM
jgi:hypothetical protein